MAIYKVDGRAPQVGAAAFVADNATLAGDVTLAEESSVWYGAVLRGDRAPITIGPGSNIQENCVVHVAVLPSGRAAMCRTTPCCTPARGWMWWLDGMCPLATVPWCMGVPWGMIV